MAKTEQISKVSGAGILMMLVGIAGLIFFSWQISDALNATDPMQKVASKMSKLESRSGNSVAEAYYDYHGEYLDGEAKAYERIAIGIDVIGIMASILVFGYGGSKKTLVEAVVEKASPSRSVAKKSRKDDEEEEDI